jgi:hypothetical protein
MMNWEVMAPVQVLNVTEVLRKTRKDRKEGKDVHR